MKILVFVEGTILMHASAQNVSREKRVKQSHAVGIQREERNLTYENDVELTSISKNSVYDFASYIPIGNASQKLKTWVKQGAQIYYLSSRRIKSELNIVGQVLDKYKFPNVSNFYFRGQGKDYKDVAEKIMPDILIEDNCESIGGKKEMIQTHIKQEIKNKIKLISVKEFSGIDHLPDDLNKLKKYKDKL